MIRRVASQAGLNAAQWFRTCADRIELFTLGRVGVHVPQRPDPPTVDDDVEPTDDGAPYDPISPEAAAMIAKVVVETPPVEVPLAGSLEERAARVKAW